VRAYETDLYRFLETRRPEIVTTVAEQKQIDDQLKSSLAAALKEFGEQFAATAGKTAA
jgi:F0F1-type ATP synthase alpha subunit